MKQRVVLLIEIPDVPEKNVSRLKDSLIASGCKVEVRAIINPLKGFKMPDTFLFKEEK